MITLGVFVFALFTERENPDDVETFREPQSYGGDELVTMESFLKLPALGRDDDGHSVISMPQKSL
jgi:hypothetical protein